MSNAIKELETIITEQTFDKIDKFLDSGKNLEAIRYVRQLTELGLKDSKDIIDSWGGTTRQALRAVLDKGDIKIKYGATKEDLIQDIKSLASQDFEDEVSLEKLEADISLCSKELIRWILYRIAKKAAFYD